MNNYRYDHRKQSYGLFLKKHSADVRKLSFSLDLAIFFSPPYPGSRNCPPKRQNSLYAAYPATAVTARNTRKTILYLALSPSSHAKYCMGLWIACVSHES